MLVVMLHLFETIRISILNAGRRKNVIAAKALMPPAAEGALYAEVFCFVQPRVFDKHRR